MLRYHLGMHPGMSIYLTNRCRLTLLRLVHHPQIQNNLNCSSFGLRIKDGSKQRGLGGGQLQKNRGGDCVGLAIEEQSNNRGGIVGVYVAFGIAGEALVEFM
ncbi:hypothetical protein HanRHA438_Chr01g0007911 [Helianthus annuus]|nr:hypothetical protein HanRHA438_Chr01g0007911 [Helianthus annuus]